MTGTDADRPHDAATDHTPLRIDVRRGNPTPEELAAAIAVVSESYRSEAAAAVADPGRRRTAWELSARALRDPLERASGWGRFRG